MSERDEGGRAFPGPYNSYGMTLRDYFAAQALIDWREAVNSEELTYEQYAVWCYEMADAMLKARTA